MKNHRRIFVIIFIIISLIISGAELKAEPDEYSIRIYCDQPIEKIKHQLGGVALGGSAHSYLKPEIKKTIKRLDFPLVRLEAVPGSYPELFNPQSGKYNWTGLDAEIEAIQETGAEIVLNIFYMPKWLSAEPHIQHGLFSPPRDYKIWWKLIFDIVKHVNVQKKFGIKYWEIWNEPSGRFFFRAWDKGKINEFWKLYEITADAIKSADPTALVGGFADNPDYSVNFQSFFRYCKLNNVPIDFVSLHWYAFWEKEGYENPELYFHFANSISKLYKKYFGKRPELIWSEWNHLVDCPGPDLEKQASYMGSALYWMQESVAEKAMFFRIEPYVKRGESSLETVLNEDNKIQVSGRILKMFLMLPDQRINVSNYPRDTFILAAKDEKRLAIMITRRDFASDKDIRLNLEVLAPSPEDRNFMVEKYVEDRNSSDAKGFRKPMVLKNQKIEQGRARVSVLLKNHSVALLNLKSY
jgi:xylan 1,4-beta-xylosidase